MIEHKYIEALLFASVAPLSYAELSEILQCEEDVLSEAVESYKRALEEEDRGLRLRIIGDKMELVSASDCAKYVERIREKEEKLTPAALETLAIVAFKQPITKAEIEEIRGVSCDNIIKHLLQKDLLTKMGHKAVIGKPILYGTTDLFLHSIGASTIDDLRRLVGSEVIDKHEILSEYSLFEKEALDSL